MAGDARLTPAREAEIRARLAAATPGPWRQTHDIKRGVKLWGRDGEPLYLAISPLAHSRVSAADPVPQWQKDADFVRNARTDVAAALDEIAELRAERRALAKLASETPQFDNPLRVYEAQALRDRVLAEASHAR